MFVSHRNKAMKKYGVDQVVATVVGYYFCDEPIPYRTTIPGKNVTLGQFKQHIAKKGNYRLVLSVYDILHLLKFYVQLHQHLISANNCILLHPLF